MFHNTPQNDPKIHADNIQAGTEMKAYLAQLVRQRRAELKADPSVGEHAFKAAENGPAGGDWS